MSSILQVYMLGKIFLKGRWGLPTKCQTSVLFGGVHPARVFTIQWSTEEYRTSKPGIVSSNHVFVCRVELLINCWLSDVSSTVNLYSATSPGREDETFSDCINFQKIVPILTEGDQALSGLFAALIPTFKIIQTSRTQGVHPILRNIDV